MCGIITAFNYGDNKEPVNEWIKNQLQDQFHRGSKGFGIVFINEDGSYKIERATESTKTHVDLELNQSRMIMLHHRYPTSSENKISQTHPIVVDDGSLKHKYLVVHNGVINNDTELKKQHEDELGFVYTTQRKVSKEVYEYNDSEALAIEVARFIEGEKKINTIGNAAFIALQIDKKTDKVTNVFFARHNNPIKMSKTRGKLRLSSEGEGTDISEEMLYHCSIKDFKLQKKKVEFGEYEKVEVIEELNEYPGWVKSINTSNGKTKYAPRYNKETGIHSPETAITLEEWNKKQEKEYDPLKEVDDIFEDVPEDMLDVAASVEDEVGKEITQFLGDLSDSLLERGKEIGVKKEMEKEIKEIANRIALRLSQSFDDLGDLAEAELYKHYEQDFQKELQNDAYLSE